MKKVTFTLFMIAFIMITISCNQGPKTNEQSNNKEKSTTEVKENNDQRVSGNYICTEHWSEDLVGNIKMTFRNDSVSLQGMPKTTYRIKNDSLFIDMHQYEMGFLINGKTLTTKGGAGVVSYTKE
jgi:hypothetical protein